MCGKQSLVTLSLFGVIFFLLTFTSSLQKSPTFDEPMHLFAGYSYLKWGDFRANPEHPPLAKMLAALPLLVLNLKDPRPENPHWNSIPYEGGSGWALAQKMVFQDNDAETLFLYARLPMIALAVSLGFFVYLWAKELYGFQAGLFALFLYALDPNILAHSPIIHTDVPFTAFFFIGTYFCRRALGRLTWRDLFLASLFLGLSATTKYSFFSILASWAILGLVKIFSPEAQQSAITLPGTVASRRGKLALLLVVLSSAVLIAFLCVWTVYGFRFEALADEKDRYLPLASVMPETSWLRNIASLTAERRLLPEAWTYGLLYTFQSLQRAAYLLGRISTEGFWFYFPVVFLVKTPLPTLFLFVAGSGFWLFSRKRLRTVELFLLIPIIVYVSLAVWSRMNIGVRHLLPLYPFLFVLLGGMASKLYRSAGLKRASVIVLALWLVGSTASVYPHYLAFFNEAAGGPRNGFKILGDSNLDWGQDLKGLKRWMDQNRVRSIYLAYFGTADPRYYGIRFVHLPGFPFYYAGHAPTDIGETPKYFAVSATNLQGVYLGPADREIISRFQNEKPIAKIGHSIFIYRLDASD